MSAFNGIYVQSVITEAEIKGGFKNNVKSLNLSDDLEKVKVYSMKTIFKYGYFTIYTEWTYVFIIIEGFFFKPYKIKVQSAFWY